MSERRQKVTPASTILHGAGTCSKTDEGLVRHLPTVNEIVRRRRAVTAEMALRLARYFGTTAQLWQNLQSQYDLEIASQKIGKKVERSIKPLERPDLAGHAA